jgi:hypothetical protein
MPPNRTPSILRDLRAGIPIKHVAYAHGVTLCYVYRAARALGIPVRKSRPWKSPPNTITAFDTMPRSASSPSKLIDLRGLLRGPTASGTTARRR